MNRRTYERIEKSDDDYKYRLNNKRSDRSRSPPNSHSSYGITNQSYNKNKSSTKSNGFIPDEETKKFYDKSINNDTGFWTSEDYTFRDMLAKDVRSEIEDDIASKNSDEESEEDPEIAEYADRADMDDNEDEEQKKTIVERVIPIKKDEEKKKDFKLEQTLTNTKTSSSSTSRK